jgi:hypothetical protein
MTDHPTRSPDSVRTLKDADLDTEAGMSQMLIQETEAEFQKRVVQLAESLGWGWMHIEPMGSPKGWRTPTKGPLRHWPDLFMVRGHRAVIFELKAQKAPLPSTEQRKVLQALSAVPSLEVYTMRPSDWPLIFDLLT